MAIVFPSSSVWNRDRTVKANELVEVTEEWEIVRGLRRGTSNGVLSWVWSVGETGSSSKDRMEGAPLASLALRAMRREVRATPILCLRSREGYGGGGSALEEASSGKCMDSLRTGVGGLGKTTEESISPRESSIIESRSSCVRSQGN